MSSADQPRSVETTTPRGLRHETVCYIDNTLENLCNHVSVILYGHEVMWLKRVLRMWSSQCARPEINGSLNWCSQCWFQVWGCSRSIFGEVTVGILHSYCDVPPLSRYWDMLDIEFYYCCLGECSSTNVKILRKTFYTLCHFYHDYDFSICQPIHYIPTIYNKKYDKAHSHTFFVKCRTKNQHSHHLRLIVLIMR